jgi:hypothetical protein
MSHTDELLATSASNRAALQDLGAQQLLDIIQKLQNENSAIRVTLDDALCKIGEWAFVINQSRADRAFITPITQEMNDWVRDYA